MAEESWGDDFQEPVRRAPGVPRWVWTCGCGCLVGAIALVVVLVASWDWIVERAESLGDPDQQWPLVSEVLPVEDPPENLAIMKFPLTDWMGLDIWYLADRERELHALLMTATGEAGVELVRTMLETASDTAAFDQPIEPEDVEEVEIQGRSVRVLRFQPVKPGENEERPNVRWPFDSQWGNARGAGAMIDVSPVDGERRVLIQLMRESSREPLTDDELRSFLKPFGIGEGR